MRRHRPWVLLGLLPLLLAACGITDSDGPLEERDRLEENAVRWGATQPAHYAFVLERGCFCGTEVTAPVRIEVQNGVVVSRTYADGGDMVPEQWHDLFPAIEGVFQVLLEALDQEAAQFDVHYDAVRGYPRTAWIDYALHMADEELTLQVTGFSVE